MKKFSYLWIAGAALTSMGAAPQGCFEKNDKVKIDVSNAILESTRGVGPVQCCDNKTDEDAQQAGNQLTDKTVATQVRDAILDMYAKGDRHIDPLPYTPAPGESACGDKLQKPLISVDRGPVQKFRDQTGGQSSNSNVAITIGDIDIPNDKIEVTLDPDGINPDGEKTQGELNLGHAMIAFKSGTDVELIASEDDAGGSAHVVIVDSLPANPAAGIYYVRPGTNDLNEPVRARLRALLPKINEKDGAGNYINAGAKIRDLIARFGDDTPLYATVTGNCFGDFRFHVKFQLIVPTKVVVFGIFSKP